MLPSYDKVVTPDTDSAKFADYYRALSERQSSYVGIFFAGVKTTHIFCIATCRARKPKKENVEFFTDYKAALSAGYRPCKICKPTENSEQAPEQVTQAIDLVRNNPKQKISDFELRQNHISPDLVRRWFKNHYQITFHTFQRMYRINNAFIELKSGGKSATDTALDHGYDSLSGFSYTYKKLMGNSPQKSMKNNVILIHRFTTPLGPMFACATDEGLCLLEFVDRKKLETEFKDLQRLLKAEIITGENDHIRSIQEEINQYFNGELTTFNTKIHSPGTEFQNQVWQALQSIPYGQTRSYQDQANIINKPKAVRAVANANGCNRLAIVIPCHRVIGKDGSLTGYAGGLERKRWLLEHEKANSNQH